MATMRYEATTDFVYVRLHGSQELHVSGYTDEERSGSSRDLPSAM